MAYFRCSSGSVGGGATITVTYDSSFYNKTITCSDGTTTYTKTTTSSGSTEFSVKDEGTWTITCNGVAVPVTVTLNYSTQMKPTGSTATPINDVQTWLKCGGIFDKNYTTVNQVLADTTTLLALISDNNAVDYMVRSTNFASSVCANATAMTDIGANNYCANTLLANSTWRTAICNSTYFESVLNVKVPTMTSNTTPSGEAFASSTGQGAGLPYKAFDNDDSTSWAPTIAGTIANTVHIGYDFTTPVVVDCIKIKQHATYYMTSYKVQGYNGSSWVDVSGTITETSAGTLNTIPISNSTAYSKYRVVGLAFSVQNENFSVYTLQFY